MDQSSVISERRTKARLWCSYPAKVSGRDSSGKEFEETTTLDNLSASGVLLHLRTEIKPEANLSVVFRASKTAPLVGDGKGPLIAIEGRVIRTEKHLDGLFGVAVKIHTHRFL